MKTLPLLIALALGSPAFAFDTIEYTAASGTPESEGWIKQGKLETPIGHEGTRTYVDINDNDPADGAAFLYKIDPTLAAETDQGFALEVAGRIEPSEGPSSHRVELSVASARVVIVLNSLKGQQTASLIRKESNTPLASTSGDSEFHVWKVIGKPGEDGLTRLSFYCDGQLIGEKIMPLDKSAPQITFGSLGGSSASRTGHVLYERITLRPLKDNE